MDNLTNYFFTNNLRLQLSTIANFSGLTPEKSQTPFHKPNLNRKTRSSAYIKARSVEKPVSMSENLPAFLENEVFQKRAISAARCRRNRRECVTHKAITEVKAGGKTKAIFRVRCPKNRPRLPRSNSNGKTRQKRVKPRTFPPYMCAASHAHFRRFDAAENAKPPQPPVPTRISPTRFPQKRLSRRASSQTDKAERNSRQPQFSKSHFVRRNKHS